MKICAVISFIPLFLTNTEGAFFSTAVRRSSSWETGRIMAKITSTDSKTRHPQKPSSTETAAAFLGMMTGGYCFKCLYDKQWKK